MARLFHLRAMEYVTKIVMAEESKRQALRGVEVPNGRTGGRQTVCRVPRVSSMFIQSVCTGVCIYAYLDMAADVYV